MRAKHSVRSRKRKKQDTEMQEYKPPHSGGIKETTQACDSQTSLSLVSAFKLVTRSAAVIFVAIIAAAAVFIAAIVTGIVVVRPTRI